MKKADFKNKKVLKAAKTGRLAGVQVRSGVKGGVVTGRDIVKVRALDRVL